MRRRIALLDGNNLMFRAFYALPLMEAEPGVYTNAAYGFMTMTAKVISDWKPTHLAVAFDMHGPTFRHESYAEYKAGRRETPKELGPQFDLLRGMLRDCGFCYYQLQGYEADDIIGTIAARVRAEGDDEVLIVTGDRDSFQLIGGSVCVLFTRRGLSDVERLDSAALVDGYGVSPERVTDLKGLMGDSSDNIPGIPGIGEKTALKLLAQFGTLEGVLAGVGELKGKLKERVEAGAESAVMSKRLATIDCNIPLETVVDDMTLPDLNKTGAAEVFARYRMKSLAERFSLGAPDAPKAALAQTQREICTIADETAAAELARRAAGAERVALLMGERALSVAFGEGELYQLPLAVSLIDDGFAPERALELMRPLLEAEGQVKLLYDAKQLRTRLAAQGLSLAGHIEDMMLCEYLLEGCADKLFFTDAGVLWDAAPYYAALLEETGMSALYRDVELPLSDVLYSMEREGFTIDAARLRAIGEGLRGRMRDIEQAIYLMAGHSFNILSPKQLGAVLFDELGLPAAKKTKTGYSTDAQVLEGLLDKHEIVAEILEYRMLSKLEGTYIDGLISKADSNGRIHSTFYQTGTVTGRLSSAEPNLQNIPVRTEQGRMIRGAFVPSAPGRLLVSADYSQIELRVLAHMSGDERFIAAFAGGEDIHARTAAEIAGVPISQVTREMRSAAKAVNFGIVYGISDFGLARNIGVSRKQAAEYIDKFFVNYPAVKAFMDRCVAEAKTSGYSATMFGRRRYIPELRAGNYNTRSFGERAAMNTPIQGSAADVIKLAMVRVSRALAESGLDARMILQVHDELILDVRSEDAAEAMALLKREMEAAAKLDAPLVAEASSGATWQDCK